MENAVREAVGAAEQEITIEQAIEFVKEYIAKTGKTQAAVAQELGISSGALSSFISGSYKTPHTIVPKVRNLMEISEKKKISLTDPPFVETSVSKMVKNAIKYSHIRGKISVVYGDAGIGKTQAFRSYLRENGLAIGITIAPTYASIKELNKEEAILVIDSMERRSQPDSGHRMTQKQFAYIKGLMKKIGWVDEGGKPDLRRLDGFCHKRFSLSSHKWLASSEASNVIEGLKNMIKNQEDVP